MISALQEVEEDCRQSLSGFHQEVGGCPDQVSADTLTPVEPRRLTHITAGLGDILRCCGLMWRADYTMG